MINLNFENQYVCLISFEHKASEKGAADVIASSMMSRIQDKSVRWIPFWKKNNQYVECKAFDRWVQNELVALMKNYHKTIARNGVTRLW